jgi:hypothetical protein
MTATLLALSSLAAVVLLWLDFRAAAERAQAGCLRACGQAGVQLLDSSVALSRVRLRRRSNGRVGLLRRYVFEFSTDGADRHPGSIELHGRQVLWVRLPLPPPAT